MTARARVVAAASAAEWDRRCAAWLPSAFDRAYVQSLQTKPVMEPGQIASWLAPPGRGIDGRPQDFVYVRHD